MASAAHLVRRFAGSLRPGGPTADDEAWARSQLLPDEARLWARLSGPDRRHAVGVARRVERALGAEATRAVLAAALLHDVGKVEAGLGTYGRVVATLAAAVAGRDMADRWQRSRGFTRRVGLYLNHPAIGGDLLAMAGSDPLTEAWAREHHLPPERWTVPRPVADALKAADDD
ncbi:MAG TPA: hypothetical protein VK007_08750 [Acidimicrobiales bacterium]|nr:hypothetical protein [Acidimicrobiales bacterium]